ncbi:LrgB family protein, partial [Spongiibacter tropicus]
MSALLHSPLFGLTLTLAAYQCALWAYRRSGQLAVLHPTISGAIVIAAALKVLGLDYFAYYADINWLNFL